MFMSSKTVLFCLQQLKN